MKSILIICLIYISLFAKFINDDQGNIIDSKTTFIWQNNSDVKKGSWEEAIKYCEELEYGGYIKGSWKLPSSIDLYSLVDLTKANPAINSAFEYIRYGYNENYWTRSVNRDGKAVAVNFALGTTNYFSVTKKEFNTFNVLCVVN